MSTNIIFPTACHQALTATLRDHPSIQAESRTTDLNLRQMLLTIGLKVYADTKTGNLVVDSLEGHAQAELIENKALKLLADYAESEDKEAPYVELADEDGAPYKRWVMLADGTWKAYAPVLSWAPENLYI